MIRRKRPTPPSPSVALIRCAHETDADLDSIPSHRVMEAVGTTYEGEDDRPLLDLVDATFGGVSLFVGLAVEGRLAVVGKAKAAPESRFHSLRSLVDAWQAAV